MAKHMNRRTLLKGAAAGAATAAAASPVFHVPNVIAQSPTEITYWGSFAPGSVNGDAEAGMVERFNTSQSEVAVKYEFQGTYEETAQKLTAGLAAQQVPDVSLLSDVWWFKFYLNRALAPLNDLITANNVDTTDYVDSLINEGNRDGVQYWMPMARSTPLFYFNRDAFKEVGVTEAPKTWDEFMSYAPQLVKKDGDTITRAAFGHPSSASYIAWLFQGVVWQHGGEYSDAEFNMKLNEEGAVAAGNFYRSSVADGWATTPVDPDADFINGLTASQMASTGGLTRFIKEATFDWGTAFLPEGPAGFGCCTGGAGLAILAASEKQEAAFKFVAFTSTPENTAWWSLQTGYMPVRKSARENAELVAFWDANPQARVAVEQLAKTRPQDAARVFVPNGDQIIGGGLERVTIDQEEVQPVFDEVNQTLTDEAAPVLEAIEELQSS
jgi:sn-glycerol 3-phosphate transport system substrate-binding protein